MTVHHRRARLAFAPAYRLSYTHGSRYTPSRADIVPQHHEALLSGLWGGGVAAEAHLSAGKGAAAAGSVVGAASMLAFQVGLVGWPASGHLILPSIKQQYYFANQTSEASVVKRGHINATT
jgi:hypothetical protein